MQRQLTDGGIKLVKRSGSPVFVKETKLIGEKGKHAADESVEIEGETNIEPDDAELVSGNLTNPFST